MLIAEGALYSFNGNYDVAGIVGDASAIVDWGDGTTSPVASISGGNQTGSLRIRFDYSFDTRGFFSGSNASRRNVLQVAADSMIKRFGDDLAAITPGGIKEWIPSINHPSNGPSNSITGTPTNLARNLRVNANEIVIYAGSRNLPGFQRGVGGQASYQFPATQISCRTQAECNQKLAEIEAFRDVVRGRGEPGALGTTQSDVAPHIGTISFDSDSDWYFGLDPNGIQPQQVDFLSVATHEIAHVLGFGYARSDVTTAWERLTSSGVMTGAKSRAAYEGSGSPPVTGGHWASSILSTTGQATLMSGSIALGQRTPLSTLDLAALDDIGWDLLNMRTTVSANHRYADDGQYDATLILKGSRGGEVPRDVASISVTNVRPTLSVTPNQTTTVGQPIALADLATFTDPGFNNSQATPPTTETFSYTINWGDGSEVDSGEATIDLQGNATGRLTEASIDGTHTYQTAGNKTVTVAVTDDDGGTVSRTLRINVVAPPALSLTLDRNSVTENDDSSAATLTVTRTGPVRTTNQTIQLSSSDTSEATVPSSVVIPANLNSVQVPIRAVDDALLDGDIDIDLSASGQGVASDAISLVVRDHETLTATLSDSTVQEGESVQLVIRRSNTDTAEPILVQIAGNDSDQLDLPSNVTIAANQSQITIPVAAIEDEEYERSLDYVFTFSSVGYVGDTLELELTDNEPPRFQNVSNVFDVNDDNQVTAADALRIINQLARLGGASPLDPNTEPSPGLFVDVSGDYMITARDALLIINELARTSTARASEPEQILPDALPADVSQSRLRELRRARELALLDQVLQEIANG
ncbi:MAG: dockerin type I domain-containing protein [Rubripirellula sp.]